MTEVSDPAPTYDRRTAILHILAEIQYGGLRDRDIEHYADALEAAIAHPAPTVEPVAWCDPLSLKFAQRNNGVYVATSAHEGGCYSEPLYPAATISALVAERDEARAAELRIHHEKVDHFEARIAAESALTAANARVERMEKALAEVDAKIVDMGLAAQRKVNGSRHEKFARLRQSARFLIRAALTGGADAN